MPPPPPLPRPMLADHLTSMILDRLGHEATADQRRLIEGLGAFLSAPADGRPLMIRGYAGTGKTSVVAAVVRAMADLRQGVVLLAPTGRAANVLAGYAGMPASTIHRKIYRQKSTTGADASFALDRNPHRGALFIVDEASMIGDRSDDGGAFGSGNLLADLLQYVDSGGGCRLVLSGDVAQLPPVGVALSPALREGDLAAYGHPPVVFALREVVRQARESGILALATRIRERLARRDYSLPVFPAAGGTGRADDVRVIDGGQLQEAIEECYARHGLTNVCVVTRSNRQANVINAGIRSAVLWRDYELEAGDILMVARNNYFWTRDETQDGSPAARWRAAAEAGNGGFIANGDVVRVERIGNQRERHGLRFADATLALDDDGGRSVDATVMLDTLAAPTPALDRESANRLYQGVEAEHADIRDKRERYKKVRGDLYYNALQVKYAYAVTCHKAQGGQWEAVFVDQGYFTNDMMGQEYLRWLYTAVTRARKRLYLVNFRPDFFE